MIVDAHSHVYPEVNGRVGAGPTRGLGYGRMAIGDRVVQALPPLNPRTEHTPEMLLANLDWAGVDRAVLLQGTFYGECDAYVAAAVAAHPDRLAGALWCDPWREGFRRYFDEQAETGAFRVGKIEFSDASGLCGVHPGARLDDPHVTWLYGELERRGMTLTLDLGPPTDSAYQTEAVGAIAQAHEGLRVVIAHLAHPRTAVERDPQLRARRQAQLDLGLKANVWFDIASFPNFLAGEEDFPYPTASRWLREAVECVGVDRILWGTDQPGLLGYLTYPQLVRLARLHTAFLSPEGQARILGGTAARVYFGEG